MVKIHSNLIPSDVKEMLKVLNNHYFEGFVVGGAVRDACLNKTPHDWDICTNAKPHEIKQIFKKTFDTGIKHGTVTVLSDNNEAFEITTYRSDGKYTDGRRPDTVEFVTSINEDLSRRDFTINAMAMDISGTIIDPFGGYNDLIKNHLIKCVGDPDKRFNEDALRMLRAIRFSAVLGFKIDENTFEAIKRNKDKISLISAERIRDELTKILLSSHPSTGFKALELSGLSEIILPEYNRMSDCYQKSPFHYSTVAEHSLNVVEKVPPVKELRWAALLHDCGKPDTQKWNYEKDRDTFYNHPAVSKEITRDILNRLKFSNEEKRKILNLVEFHDYYSTTPSKLRRFIAEHDEDFPYELILLKKADAASHHPEYITEIENHNKVMFEIMEEILRDGSAIKISDLAINGNELMEIGLRGHQIADFKESIYPNILGQPDLNTKEFLTEQAKKFFNKEQRHNSFYEEDSVSIEL